MCLLFSTYHFVKLAEVLILNNDNFRKNSGFGAARA